MKSFLQNKLAIILLAALALGALTVLAISLDEVPFKEGQRYAQEERQPLSPLPPFEVNRAWGDIPMWKLILLWILVALMVLLIALLLSPEMRRKFLRSFFRTFVTLLLIYYVLRNYGDRIFGLGIFGGNGLQPADAATAPPMPEFQPPEVSPTVSYLISFGFALLMIVLLWALYRGWKKYVALNSQQPLEEIARIARSSLRDLQAGRDTSDVIIKCYLRMSDVVADKRQLHREIAMTPQEFAVRLERAGLPGDAVRRLTRLFEMVRYGERKSAPKDVSEAVSCLNTILHYCGEPI